MIKKLELKSKRRWKILLNEGKWLCGLYIPEFRRKEEIDKLEKHDAPELFLLIEGKVNLVVKDKGREREISLAKGEATVLDCWHNAYGKGKVFVVERAGVSTEFMKRGGGGK